MVKVLLETNLVRITDRTELWKIHDNIQYLKNKRDLFGGINQDEDLTLRNLEEKFYQEWSDNNQF